MQTHKYFWIVLIFAIALGVGPAIASAASNLVPNPSLEEQTDDGRPLGWHSGGWGNNNADYDYPVPGNGSEKAAKVTISNHETGDAKWYSDDIAITGGKEYRFEVDYRSSAETYAVIKYKLEGGQDSFVNLGAVPASSEWSRVSKNFTAPEEATHLAIYYLLANVGELTTDNYGLFLLNEEEETGSNLIGNPSVEEQSGNNPTGWGRGRWGSNTAVFSYPVVGRDSDKAIKIALTQRISGDAKWYFQEVPVTGGKRYRFEVDYQANVPSFITAQYRLNNGALSYIDLDQPSPSVDWSRSAVEFTVPANATHVTIFHLINRVGELTTDNYSLQETLPPEPPDPSNLITNPSFETASGNLPLGWGRGRWGSNTAIFNYPVAGHDTEKAAEVILTQRSSGDAKWYFQDIPVKEGKKYLFSNSYRASVPSFITVQFLKSDGSYRYVDLLALPPSEDWQTTSYSLTIPSGVTALTVFHLIKDVGSLTVDNYLLREDIPSGPSGMVSLAFDDGWKSIHEHALPKLGQAGYKGTFYFITGRFGYPAYMTTEQVLEFQQAGHEIGAHSRSHNDLTAMSETEATDEIKGSMDDLIDIGINEVKTFAYPFGNYNEQIKQIIHDSGYMAARSSDGGLNQRGNIDLYALKRRPADSGSSLAQVKSWIDQAENDRNWLILNFHRIDYDGTTYSVTPEFLQAVIDYLKQKNVQVVTVEEGVSMLGTQALSL